MTPAATAASTDTLALLGGTPVSSSMIPLVQVKLDESDIQAALGVMRAGGLAMGKNCLALEQEFAQLTDAAYALTCANGTCALQLVYEPLFERGDEVLVPAWSYIATASMVVARGAIPVFVDADPRTYNIDMRDAASKITPRTAAIAATHLYGNPVDIDAVEKLAAKHTLSVVYDAAQAHLATYKGRGIGAYGDAVTYSFYPTKNMTTGEGGLITTNDEDLALQVRMLRSHGETTKYTHTHIGYNYRMTDIEGAIGLSQLQRLPELTARRRANAAALDRAIAEIPGLTAPTTTVGGEHAYHLYAVRLDLDSMQIPAGLDVDRSAPSAVRDAFCKALNAEGVATAIHYPRSLTHQPVFESMVDEHPPVAESLASCLFCIPVHQFLTTEQVARIGEALAKVASAFRS